MDARTRRREPKGIPIGGRFARGGTGADASDLTGPASGRMTRAAVEARARWLSANSDIAAYDADVERWNGQMAEYVAERQAIRDEAYSRLVDAKGRPTKRTQARLDADGIGDVVPLHDRMMMLAADDCAERTDALGVPDPPRPEPPRLEERRKQTAGTLSGGEQQMLAMGRALMSRPKLLMLDEPSMGLAPILVEQIFDIIRELHAAGTTILLVEQNANAALSVANRAYVLETGRIVLSGTGDELMHSEQVQKAYLGG